jgi:hypothetical protein
MRINAGAPSCDLPNAQRRLQKIAPADTAAGEFNELPSDVSMQQRRRLKNRRHQFSATFDERTAGARASQSHVYARKLAMQVSQRTEQVRIFARPERKKKVSNSFQTLVGLCVRCVGRQLPAYVGSVYSNQTTRQVGTCLRKTNDAIYQLQQQTRINTLQQFAVSQVVARPLSLSPQQSSVTYCPSQGNVDFTTCERNKIQTRDHVVKIRTAGRRKLVSVADLGCR